MFEALERYASVTDVRELLQASKMPLRKSIRVNTLKHTIKNFEQWARTSGWRLTQVPWCKEGFFIEREDRSMALGKDMLHMLGHTYIQEASSMLPVALLNPKPEDTVLDMSAAPGSKTTQIAACMEGQGVLIANDMQEKRLWTLNANLQRAGVMHAVVTKKVGQWFARHMTERFDRVLCDAPCTAQGTVRKDSDALKYASEENIRKMARLQCDLLESAIHATKVGGRIVYSTCTLTPEENEEVIAMMLSKFGDQISVLHEEESMGKSGIVLARAREESERVQRTWMKRGAIFPAFRLWPQTYDTEGFFCAVLEKRARTKDVAHMETIPRYETPLSRSNANEIRARLRDWYGTDFLREKDMLFASKKQIFAVTREAGEYRLPVSDFSLGLPLGKPTTHGLLRLSHDMATLRGLEAPNQFVDITEEQCTHMLHGQNLRGIETDAEDGDVLLATTIHGQRLCIGRGLLKKGDILNRLPREIVGMHG